MGAEGAPPVGGANTGGQGTISQRLTQQTLGAPTPPDAGPFAAMEQQLRALEGSANRNLGFSESGELTAAAKGPLNQLAEFLKDNPGAIASISNEALTRGLLENPPADLEKRKAAVIAYVKSVDESASVRIAVGREPAPAQPAGGTSTTPPQPSGELQVLGDVRIGTYQVGLQKQEITTDSGAPQIAVLYRSSDAFAHIIVREPDGTRKIVKVEQGVDLSKQLTGADIWTKNEKGAGVKQSGAGKISLMTLSAEQKKQIEDTLAKIQQKPAPASSTPPADAAGAQGAGATTPEQGAGATGGSNGQQQGGAGGGGSTPPTGGTQGPGSQPERPLKILPDGRFDKAERPAMLGMLKADGAVRLLNQEYPGKVKSNEDGKLVVEVEPGKYVAIAWTTGETTRKGNPSDEAVADFENVVRQILTGSVLPGPGRPRSLPDASIFTVMDGLSEAEKKALKIALPFQKGEKSFVKTLAGELGFSMRRDGTNTVHLSSPHQGSRLQGIDIVTFDRETGDIQFTRGRAGVGISDEQAIRIMKEAIRNSLDRLS